MLAKRINVLLIEDNPADARLFTELLSDSEKLDAAVVHVTRLDAAAQLLREQEFDVIFLDLSLPDSFGFQTFATLHDQAPGAPIILLTGYEDETLVARALNLGAQDYLVKGKFDGELLCRATRYAIERYRLLAAMEEARALEQHLAYHDALTHLPNRTLLLERLQQALLHTKRYPGLLAVLFIDLDGFKEVNDSKGHATGDALLQSVARRLTQSVRESDTVARLGGDEFVVLLKGTRSQKDIEVAATKLLQALALPHHVGGNQVEITASVGISVAPQDGQDAELLIRKADLAMYQAKRSGKNRFSFYEPSLARAQSTAVSS